MTRDELLEPVAEVQKQGSELEALALKVARVIAQGYPHHVTQARQPPPADGRGQMVCRRWKPRERQMGIVSPDNPA
jgi:hypothetical protein